MTGQTTGRMISNACASTLRMAAHCVLLVLPFAAFQQNASAQITIRANEPRQQIIMMGADMERSADALQSAANKEEIIKWVFEDIHGINYLRVVYDKHQELKQGRKNLEFYDKQIASMRQIKAVSPDIRFWATLKTDYDGYGRGNNLPDWIYTGGGYNGGKYDPDKLDVVNYAGFLADYLELMHRNEVGIYGLSVVKEWSQVVDSKRAGEVIRELKDECARRKIPTPIFIGPASWGVKGGTNDLREIKKLGDDPLYAGFAMHRYDKPTEAQWKEAVDVANSMNRPLFDDETSVGSGGPNHGEDSEMAKVVNAFIDRAETYRAGLSGEVFFETWSRGIARETRSIYFEKGGPARRLRGYWLLKAFAENVIFSHYLPSTTAAAVDGFDTMAFRKDFSTTLWVMNATTLNLPDTGVTIDGTPLLQNHPIEIKTWRESDPTLEGVDLTTTPASGSRFSVDIPAESVTRIRFKHAGFIPDPVPTN